MNLVQANDGTYINLDQLCLLNIYEPHPSWAPEKQLYRVHATLAPTGDFSSSGNNYELGAGFRTRDEAVAEMISYVKGERALHYG